MVTHRATTPATALAARLCGLAAGTRLLTPHGFRPVETLSPGDLVQVGLDGPTTVQPITWMGRRNVSLSRRKGSERLVRIRRYAFAADIPDRDVYLAEEHAIYQDGKLFQVRDLVNGGSIYFEKHWRSVTYWGVQLDRHNVVLADGLPVETLLAICAGAFAPIRPPAAAADAVVEGAPNWETVQLQTEIRTALNTVTGLLVEHGVKADYAVPPNLTARCPSVFFQSTVVAMLRQAILSGSGEGVLLVASQQGSSVRVSVSYYLTSANVDRQEADLRPLQEAVGLRGMKLVIGAQSESSLTVSLVLPAA